MSKVDIPDWVNWIAQDASGIWWGYSVEPLRFDKGWYENEIGDCIRLSHLDAKDAKDVEDTRYVEDATNWKDSLQTHDFLQKKL